MPKRRSARPLLFGAALLAGAGLEPRSASACSYAQVTLEASYPAFNAVDVPTNAVLFVYGTLPAIDSLVLLDAAGVPTPFDARPVDRSGYDLLPREELAAGQRYRLTLLDEPSAPTDFLVFTTGSGPAAVPDQLAPPPALDARVLEYNFATCGLITGICLTETPLPPSTTLEVRVGDEVLASNLPTFPLHRAYNQPIASDACITARLRDIRGNRSEPTSVCGDAIAHIQLQSDLYDVNYTCENYQNFVVSGEGSPNADQESNGVDPEAADAGHGATGEGSFENDTASPPTDDELILADARPTRPEASPTSKSSSTSCAVSFQRAPASLGALASSLIALALLFRRRRN